MIHDDDIEALEGALEWIDNVMAKTRVQVDHLIEETERQSSGEDARPAAPG